MLSGHTSTCRKAWLMASLPVPLNLSGGEVALGNVQELKNQNIFDFSSGVGSKIPSEAPNRGCR